MKIKDKKLITIFLALVFLFANILYTEAKVLSVSKRTQEQTNWCWAGSGQCILYYYNKYIAQCSLAEYMRTHVTWTNLGSVNCCTNPNQGCNSGNYLYGYAGSVKDVLSNWGVGSKGWNGYFYKWYVEFLINDNRPFIIGWSWYSGGGHAIVGHGIEENNIYYMDPWYGEGFNVNTYDWVVDGSGHYWSHCLEITKSKSPSNNHNLTIQSGTGGTTNPSPGTYSYKEGSIVTVRAYPYTNYKFDKWTGDASGNGDTINVLMDKAKTIKANFVPIQTRTLTIQAGTGGTTNPNPGSHAYQRNSIVSVLAIPNSNYRFDRWTGAATGSNNPIRINMNMHKTIKANFIRQYVLTIQSSNGGTTDPLPGSYKYDTGKTVSIKAKPYNYYIFINWTGSKTSSLNPLSIVMNSNKITKANFKLIHPPQNFTGEKVLNRSLSQAEYINVLKWQANPNNSDLIIINYRIYQIISGQRTLFKELDASTFELHHRGVEEQKEYVYEIAAVNSDGKEGYPARITIK